MSRQLQNILRQINPGRNDIWVAPTWHVSSTRAVVQVEQVAPYIAYNKKRVMSIQANDMSAIERQQQ